MVNGKSQFSRKDEFKVQPLTAEQALVYLNQVDKFLEPLTNISSVVN